MADTPSGGAGGLAAAGAAKDQAGSASAAAPGAANEGIAKAGGTDAIAGGGAEGASSGGAPAGPSAVPGAPSAGGPSSVSPAQQATAAVPAGAAAPPKLGAGGTSAAASGPGSDDGVIEKGGGAGKTAAAAAAVPAAGAAGQIMVLAMFINWLKGMLMAMAAIAANLWNLFVGLMLGIAKGVVGFFMSIGAGISSAVGGAISAATAGTASFLVTIVVTGTAVFGGVFGLNQQSELAQKDGGPVSCVAPAQRALDKIEGGEGAPSATVLANAKKIYSVLGAWGMSDENIAGIIGNWQAESGIDPTRVQNSPNSPYIVSPEEQAGAENLNNGIGLGQWTFGRNQNLRDYASGHSIEWGTIEAQLGFMLSAKEGSDADIVRGMIAEPKGTPGEAALYFHEKWERSADTAEMLERRATYATEWMGKFSGWTIDQTLANSILAQSGSTLGEANSTRSTQMREECRGVGQGTLSLKDGGLTLEEAEALMALYVQEGEAFLDARYPGDAGPGDCGFGKADNCVGFSTYFVNKYTSFDRYAPGNGIRTASSMAELMGKKMTNVPTVYSVGSGPGSGPEGHTFVVLGIQGDMAVVGEAVCGTDHARTKASLWPISKLTSGAYEFVNVTDLVLEDPKK